MTQSDKKARIKKSLLFLKKKKQKDFYPFLPRLTEQHRQQMGKSFLVLFFKKERLPGFLRT